MQDSNIRFRQLHLGGVLKWIRLPMASAAWRIP